MIFFTHTHGTMTKKKKKKLAGHFYILGDIGRGHTKILNRHPWSEKLLSAMSDG